MSHYRLNLFIQPEHAKRLDELAAKKGVSKSSIVAAALASWLSPDAADQREAAIAKRLDRLSRQAERMERDQNIAIETLALFIRYFLTVSTPVPEAHQDAARAQGKARFEQFVEQLGRHLLRGRSLVRDVVEELHPDPMRMEDAAADAQAWEILCSGASVFVLFRDIVGSVLHQREGNASEFSGQRNQRLGTAESALEHALVERLPGRGSAGRHGGVVEQAAHLRVTLLAQRTASGLLARIAHADIHAEEGDEGVRAAEGSAMERRAQAGGGERADAFDLQDAPVRFSPSAFVDQ